MPEPIYLLHIDDVHLADSLFLQGLAREMRKAGAGRRRVVLVHGSGEQAERRLEGEGLFRERVEGVLRVASAEEAALVDQVLRETNRKLVAMLTDEIVPAVSVQGDDRRLLQVSGEGAVTTGPVHWLRAMIDAGSVPVVSSVAAHVSGRGAREVGAHQVMIALARALGVEEVESVFFLRRNQQALTLEGETQQAIGAEQIPTDQSLADPHLVRRVVEAGVVGWLTNPAGFFAEEGVAGTRIS